MAEEQKSTAFEAMMIENNSCQLFESRDTESRLAHDSNMEERKAMKKRW